VVLTLLSLNTEKRPDLASSHTMRAEASSRCNSIYGPLAAMLGVCALIVFARPNWSLYPPRVTGSSSAMGAPAMGAPSNEKILGSVETAGVSKRVVGRVNGKLMLAGWAAFTDPRLSLTRIIILVDGAPHAEIHRFSDRSDIASHFGREDFLYSGWETSLPLSGLRPGDHNLTVEVFAQPGVSDRLRPIQLRVIE
jgi:hypothetical protein